MKTVNTHARRRAAAVARVAPTVLGALFLAGCAGTHVGDAWQCPIAQGKVCSSVAAADPAVPETRVPETQTRDVLAARSPLYEARERPATRESPGTLAAAEPGCEAGCNPFAWLKTLFAGDDREIPDAAPAPRTGSDAAVLGTPQAETESPAAALPSSREPASDDLRTHETVGRVWIGPFVDADGVYREGAWVRLLIAPAAWRLP